MTRVWLTLAAGLLAASPVWADDVKRPRVEVGGTVSAILPLVFEDSIGVVIGGGPRVTVNVSKWIRVELSGEIFGPTDSNATYGFYLTQVKLPVRTSADGARTLFVAVGAAGAASYQRVDEWRTDRPDGSTVVNPGFRRFRTSAPNSLVIGVAQDFVVNRHAAVSWGAQTFIGDVGGFAIRGTFGVSFGIGGYR